MRTIVISIFRLLYDSHEFKLSSNYVDMKMTENIKPAKSQMCCEWRRLVHGPDMAKPHVRRYQKKVHNLDRKWTLRAYPPAALIATPMCLLGSMKEHGAPMCGFGN